MSEKDIPQDVLRKLEAYGESLLDEEDYKKRKRKAARKKTTSSTDNSKANVVSSQETKTQSRRQKKRRRKQEKNQHEIKTETNEGDSLKSKRGTERHLEQLNEELGLRSFRQEMEKSRLEQLNSHQSVGGSGPEVVVYKSHKKKVKDQLGIQSQNDHPVFDMRKCRFDVHKFGIEGLRDQEKEKAKVDFLVKLGAKPPKNEYHNYKKFQEMRKTEILLEKKQRLKDRRDGLKTKAPVKQKKRRRDKNDVGSLGGQAGKYHDGVQIIRKSDLKGFRKSDIKF